VREKKEEAKAHHLSTFYIRRLHSVTLRREGCATHPLNLLRRRGREA